jgi:hypothetical protein
MLGLLILGIIHKAFLGPRSILLFLDQPILHFAGHCILFWLLLIANT